MIYQANSHTHSALYTHHAIDSFAEWGVRSQSQSQKSYVPTPFWLKLDVWARRKLAFDIWTFQLSAFVCTYIPELYSLSWYAGVRYFSTIIKTYPKVLFYFLMSELIDIRCLHKNSKIITDLRDMTKYLFPTQPR